MSNEPVPSAAVNPPSQIPREPAPYANASYTMATLTDVTILFMRIPVIFGADLEAAKMKGMEGIIIGSITLAHKQALDLADGIKRIIGELPK